jgi:uncharacterized phiE125 gp8 family phage protein
MWSPVVVSVEPTDEPVTVAVLKTHLRVDFDDDDDLIEDLIVAARMHVEARTGLKIPTQTVVMKCDTFEDLAHLPTAPLRSITSITYLDTDGATQTLAGTVYEARIDGLEPQIVLKFNQSWPSIQDRSRITVTAPAGYSTVPFPLRLAMMMVAADLYKNRESATEGPSTINAGPVDIGSLIENHRLLIP